MFIYNERMAFYEKQFSLDCTMHLPFVFFLFLLSWCFYFYWTRRRLFRLAWNVPGPLNLPFIGYAYFTLQGGVSETAHKMFKLFDTYPKLCKFWMGPHLIYFTSRAEHAKIILNSKGAMNKFLLMDYLSKTLGEGLLTQPADIWKRHRKIIAPSLNLNILNTYPKMISEQCLLALEKLEKHVGTGEIDPCKYLTNCTFDIVGETLCGFSVNAQKNNENYGEVIEKGLEIIFLRISRILYHIDAIFTRSKDGKILQKLEAILRKIAKQIIESSRDGTKKPFISLMSAELNEKEIGDEICTFLMAGTDTAAVSMCTLLTLLAMHQDVQQKVYEEVMEVVGSDPIIDLDALHKLEYTKRVIKESLRILPTVPLIGRLLDEDIVLDGTIVPKGANIVISIFHILRNEDYWTEPLKFDPDRFLPENSADRHSYAWIPFSSGPRNCIGFKHALMMMNIMAAMIIRKFKVTTSLKSIDDFKINITVVAKPIGGFKLAFERR